MNFRMPGLLMPLGPAYQQAMNNQQGQGQRGRPASNNQLNANQNQRNAGQAPNQSVSNVNSVASNGPGSPVNASGPVQGTKTAFLTSKRFKGHSLNAVNHSKNAIDFASMLGKEASLAR